MTNETYLYLAFGISFVVLAVYFWSLNNTAKNLEEEVQALRDEVNGEE